MRIRTEQIEKKDKFDTVARDPLMERSMMSSVEEIAKLKELLDKGAITQEEFMLLKQEAMKKVSIEKSNITYVKEERRLITAIGIWLATWFIITFIDQVLFAISGLSFHLTDPESRIANLYSLLLMSTAIAVPVVIAVFWKKGKLSVKTSDEKEKTKDRWWVYAIATGFCLWLLSWIIPAL